MSVLTVDAADSGLSKLVDMALEGDDVLITRDGIPVVALTALRTASGERVLGLGRGTVKILSEDWAEPENEEETDASWEGR